MLLVVVEVVDIAFDAVAMVVDFVEDFGAAMTKMPYTTEGFEEEIKVKQNLVEALQC
ncbi:hypothetical protein Patl1_23566 [Pistacia atlantica]|uniref:Uncharacterized protein n=1 Tax=Pistacia atlantica TaxID=434234 RepID=A0ACC1A0J7_9ROSI|nr:hypothetical protein Patl1_23566 [Pistacia atlantica]